MYGDLGVYARAHLMYGDPDVLEFGGPGAGVKPIATRPSTALRLREGVAVVCERQLASREASKQF